ncbi:MAG: hypothetical protein HOM58_17940 [Rhodospirillaceae bacterium]|jgi:surface antigen|nr:hypothetical protein [Rhodospirillaceae bacterium]MBT5050387.1 hypothetical protein [Rhodospirillaceae bacterium]MBT5457235.1 hypothetical protein [Rhodospirillaceae bacterium]MBT5898980.1 hypothetical protein [Rhodospirillaceae bacterium]MBT7758486.1 hypothetical protein [Rhodospirillaceae bacterium]
MGKLARTSIMISAMLSFLVLTSACQTTDSQKDTGAAVGLIIGGIAGALIGSRSGGAQLGAALGGIAGSVAGAMIGAKLDEADRIAADEARTTALAATTGDRVEWRSEENTSVHGYATPVNNQIERAGKTCRTVTQVAYIEGREIEETTEYCRVGSSGRWVQG